MQPYNPDLLPLKSIDWERHVSLIGQANAALARYDGMEIAIEKMAVRPFGINTIRELHRILLTGARGRYKDPGEIRRIQNYIAPPGTPIEEATFIPPSPETIMDALSNWEDYLYFAERDPLVQLAVLKAQFELIHPFLDGNGRIGRMLVPIILYHKKILSRPMFYISAYLERNRKVYYERLLAISRDGDWNNITKNYLSIGAGWNFASDQRRQRKSISCISIPGSSGYNRKRG